MSKIKQHLEETEKKFEEMCFTDTIAAGTNIADLKSFILSSQKELIELIRGEVQKIRVGFTPSISEGLDYVLDDSYLERAELVKEKVLDLLNIK